MLFRAAFTSVISLSMSIFRRFYTHKHNLLPANIKNALPFGRAFDLIAAILPRPIATLDGVVYYDNIFWRGKQEKR